MDKININELQFIRAGSDFLGVAWSAHVIGTGTKNFNCGDSIEIVRDDGTSYVAYILNTENIEGWTTWHITDLDGAMLFDF